MSYGTTNAGTGNGGSSFKVGDILTTARTDLGEKWLLCNGEQINAEQYPELTEILSEKLVTKAWIGQRLGIGGTDKYDIACYNGTWVAVDGDSYDSYVYITTDPTGTWTRKLLNKTQIKIRGIACYNGTWVAVGYDSTDYPCIYTTTDPTGTWTRKQLSSSAIQLQSVACYNGTWVAVGYMNYTSYAFTTTIPTGTWTMNKIYNYAKIYDVACYNGTWVAAGVRNDLYPYIFTTTIPTGTWTRKRLSSSEGQLNCIACYNGTWVAGGAVNYDPYVFTTTDLTGTWTENQLSTGIAIYDIACYNGTWVAAGDNGSSYSCIYTTTDPTGTWTENSMDSMGSLMGVACYNGIWTAVGYIEGGSRYYSYIFTTPLALPTISANGAYYYIKAEE